MLGGHSFLKFEKARPVFVFISNEWIYVQSMDTLSVSLRNGVKRSTVGDIVRCATIHPLAFLYGTAQERFSTSDHPGISAHTIATNS